MTGIFYAFVAIVGLMWIVALLAKLYLAAFKITNASVSKLR